jgi:hypothetical protein
MTFAKTTHPFPYRHSPLDPVMRARFLKRMEAARFHLPNNLTLEALTVTTNYTISHLSLP